ncbi:MAG: ABC transporter ATP-binding protein [Candidatus Saliniplasma sp.]
MIEVRNLRKLYGSYEALKDVSFQVGKGKVYSLLGSNGAGKTTIIKIITGLLEPTAGNVFIDDLDVDSNPQVRYRFGYMPEHPHLYDRLTGREFLEMNANLRGMDEGIVERRIQELAEDLSLFDVLDSEMGAYSKGMKQKILFINAVIHDPPNLILDEPTSGLDPRYTVYIKNKIKDLAKKGKTVLMSTHITSVASEISDEIAVINGGELIAEGSPQELMDKTGKRSLEEVFIEVVKDG